MLVGDHPLVGDLRLQRQRPFRVADLRWLRERFPQIDLVPINFLSYPVGIASSLLLKEPDNRLTRLSDRIDRWLEARFPAALPQARQVIVAIRKPG